MLGPFSIFARPFSVARPCLERLGGALSLDFVFPGVAGGGTMKIRSLQTPSFHVDDLFPSVSRAWPREKIVFILAGAPCGGLAGP